MDDILFDLFYGELDFNSDAFIKDSTYRAAVERADRLEDELLKSLEGQSHRDVECLINDYATITGEIMPAFFARGFRLGAQITLAVLTPAPPG